MRDILRAVLLAISAAWAKRRHDAQRDKIEDKMVADLEAICREHEASARAGRTRPERDTAHGLGNQCSATDGRATHHRRDGPTRGIAADAALPFWHDRLADHHRKFAGVTCHRDPACGVVAGCAAIGLGASRHAPSRASLDHRCVSLQAPHRVNRVSVAGVLRRTRAHVIAHRMWEWYKCVRWQP